MAIRSRIPPIPILTPPAFSLPKGKGFTKMGNLDSLFGISTSELPPSIESVKILTLYSFFSEYSEGMKALIWMNPTHSFSTSHVMAASLIWGVTKKASVIRKKRRKLLRINIHAPTLSCNFDGHQKWPIEELPSHTVYSSVAVRDVSLTREVGEISSKFRRRYFYSWHKLPNTKDTTTMDPSQAMEEGLSNKAQMELILEGDPSLPALVAAPDVGLSTELAFRPLLDYEPHKAIFSRFCIYHVKYPGQAANDADLNPGEFPSFDDLLNQLHAQLGKHNINTFLGLGVGAGGTLLLNYGLKFRSSMAGLLMINSDPLEPGWTEYIIGNADRIALQKAGMNELVLRHFLNKWFSDHTYKTTPDLVAQYKVQLAQLNPNNLAQFIDSFSGRKINKNLGDITFHVFVIVGRDGHHVTATFDSFHLFDPTLRSKLEIPNTGDLSCVEDPGSLTKPLELFLQGLGSPWGHV
ncbi:hypothetical protein PROFUN_14768 [Planoprotostelium fungivorum]|uniref:AB hydrolase-1 domain-containing protein n=1 Tax=Planoprotostelium fungivorum TaxID=1890364 RepID=A0A2P6MYR7_9EUKA|nr:hypothetical protein PROFUN_14768 [Planoprotostelium fungivorum]